MQAEANLLLESDLQRCQKVIALWLWPLPVCFQDVASQRSSCPAARQELRASIALYTSKEEDVLLRAVGVINEKKQRLRHVKAQLAQTQTDFKLFKDRTAAAAAAAAEAAASAVSPLKKRSKTAGAGGSEGAGGGSQLESVKDGGGGRNKLASLPPQHRAPGCAGSASEGKNIGLEAMAAGGGGGVAGAAAASAALPEAAPLFSRLSQNSVSTQELTKNFPWTSLGFN